MTQNELFIFKGLIINTNSYKLIKQHMIPQTDSEVMKS